MVLDFPVYIYPTLSAIDFYMRQLNFFSALLSTVTLRYNYLDRVLPGRGLGVVVRKVVWDQVIFSPICIAACILVAASLEKADKRYGHNNPYILLSKALYLSSKDYEAPSVDFSLTLSLGGQTIRIYRKLSNLFF